MIAPLYAIRHATPIHTLLIVSRIRQMSCAHTPAPLPPCGCRFEAPLLAFAAFNMRRAAAALYSRAAITQMIWRYFAADDRFIAHLRCRR